MKIVEIILSLSIEIIGALLIFLLGILFGRVPNSIKKYKLKRFFGPAIFDDNFQIVYGVFQKSRELKELLFEKVYHNDQIYKPSADYKLVPDGTIRSYAYIINELAKYRKRPVGICSDGIAYENLDKSFLTIGGPLVNELTDIVIKEESNIFFKFENIESKDVSINVIAEYKKGLSFVRSPGKNYGIILKVRNTRFKEHHFFVCAGIGIWGTSGAVWYLSNNWKKLYKEFKTKDFGIVLEVNIRSDTSAVRVYP